jgi:hypothetical protein
VAGCGGTESQLVCLPRCLDCRHTQCCCVLRDTITACGVRKRECIGLLSIGVSWPSVGIKQRKAGEAADRDVTETQWTASGRDGGALRLKNCWLWYCTVSLGLTLTNSTFCPHSVFMCFVWISEQTAIISLYSIN